jgi:hypothetical protein
VETIHLLAGGLKALVDAEPVVPGLKSRPISEARATAGAGTTAKARSRFPSGMTNKEGSKK